MITRDDKTRRVGFLVLVSTVASGVLAATPTTDLLTLLSIQYGSRQASLSKR
jgi:hypothetical protein